jgi:putative transposase
MARLPRLIVPGLPHLVSQRAQHGQAMVRDDEDRQALLRLLREAAVQQGVALHAYSVLEGRLDLVATPATATALSVLMQSVARRHAAAFNRRHARSGGLWEGRFRAAVLDPERWWLAAMLYVEQLGGVGASGVPGGEVAPRWSSQAHHTGQRVDPVLSVPPPYWALGNTPFEREAAYRNLLEQALTSAQVHAIEHALRGGWALGPPSFQQQVGSGAHRPAAPRPRGRPRRAGPPASKAA